MKPKKKGKKFGQTVGKPNTSSTKLITGGTYDDGKILRTSAVNVATLPKFFKKGMERNLSKEKTVIEKTERSLIVEKYKELAEQKLKENPSSQPRAPGGRARGKTL
jgi:hypothetical protein